MLVSSLIERKRRGEALTASEWRALLQSYQVDGVPDYQMTALLMAVFFQGLTAEELYTVTDTMLDSGASLSFEGWDTPRGDKHSTGGVGDKTSIVLEAGLDQVHSVFTLFVSGESNEVCHIINGPHEVVGYFHIDACA